MRKNVFLPNGNNKSTFQPEGAAPAASSLKSNYIKNEEKLSKERGTLNHSTKGTSMAAPHVSGVMGLFFSINPNLTTAEAREIVELTAQKIGIEPSINDSIHNNGFKFRKLILPRLQ